MPDVRVASGEKKGTFKVLVNYLQRGTIYQSEENAQHQADMLRKEFNRLHK